MKLTNKSEYACLAIIDLTEHYGQGLCTIAAIADMKSLVFRLSGKPKTVTDLIALKKENTDMYADLHLSVDTRTELYGLFYDFSVHFGCECSNGEQAGMCAILCTA
jgi:hypothetical protein